MTKRPMFPHTIDSTTLAAFRSCPQKAFLSYIEHWKPKDESVHLIAGGAFAKGIEVARRAFFEGVAIEPEIVSIFNDQTGQHERRVKWHEAAPDPHLTGDTEAAQHLGLQALMAAYGDFECPPDSAKSLERTAGALEFYFDQYPLDTDSKVPVTFVDGRRVSTAEAWPGVTYRVIGIPGT